MNIFQRFFAPLAGVVLLVIVVVAGSLWSFRQSSAAVEARRQTYELILRANALLAELKDAETSQRGYLLTGDAAFLQPYEAVHQSIVGHLDELRAATQDSAALQHLITLRPLVADKLAEMAHMVEMRRRYGMEAVVAIVASGQGQRLMDSIRAEVGSVVAIESRVLARQNEVLQSSMRQLSVLIVVASLLTLLLVLCFAWLLYRETQHRLKNVLHLETQRLLAAQEETNQRLRQANATLQVSEAKTAVTLNSIGDAVIVTDAAGRVTLMNPLAEQLTGWAQELAAHRPVDEILQIINQETRQPAAVPVQETLRHGTIKGLANHTILIARDGSERAIADSCAPIFGPDGLVAGAVLVFRDVTEEYAAQQALKDSAALIQTILNTVVDGVITLRADGGMIETANPAAEHMFGHAASELAGQNFSLLIPELDQYERDGSLDYFRASEEAHALGRGREVTGRRKDGSLFPLEIAVSEMHLGGRRFFTSVVRDITARRRAEAERNAAQAVAEAANLAKSEFLSSMSHELRTPLNAILGFAQLLEAGPTPPTPAQKRSLDQILKAGWYLLELINEILDLALIESGRVMLSPEPVSLAEVLLECSAMIGPQAQRRGIGLAFPSVEVPYFVTADRTRLKQVLINLLSNAIKYNRPQGTVAVEFALSPPNSIRLRVCDTGPGLDAEQLQQLFQPFNRLGRESGAEEGTGIGLVVTKRLVELMGGAIGAESTVGAGSVFWIELILSEAPRFASHEPDHAIRLPAPVADGTPLRTLLYVEDNPANLELVEQLIARRSDLCLLTAADGHLGIEFARTYQPDVILMDINLPGISGIQAMKILHADPATMHIPIIALSANAVPRDIEKGLEAGFFNYLTKPIRVNEFMAALDAALGFAQTNAAAKAEAALDKEEA